MSDIPIFHIASMARSGETMIQYALNQHPDVLTVFNLNKIDFGYNHELARFIMKHDKKTINENSKLLKPYNHSTAKVILMKQGIWEHRYPFDGIVLVRNPLSVYASLKMFDSKIGRSINLHSNWKQYRYPAFIQWLHHIDESIIPNFKNLSPIEQFCLFYNRRMKPLAYLNNPILHYERFVKTPEIYTKLILNIMGLDDKSIERKLNDDLGHGGFDPSKPINDNSILKYKDILTEQECNFIIESTKDTIKLYGYDPIIDSIHINTKFIKNKIIDNHR